MTDLMRSVRRLPLKTRRRRMRCVQPSLEPGRSEGLSAEALSPEVLPAKHDALVSKKRSHRRGRASPAITPVPKHDPALLTAARALRRADALVRQGQYADAQAVLVSLGPNPPEAVRVETEGLKLVIRCQMEMNTKVNIEAAQVYAGQNPWHPMVPRVARVCGVSTDH